MGAGQTRRQPTRGRPTHTGRPSVEVTSAAATQILQAALRDDCAPQELIDLIRADPAFAMRALRWVNSSAFTRPRPVTDLSQAVSLLGVRGLRSLALGIVVTSLVPHHPEAHHLLVIGLRRALAAQAVARRAAPALADTAFTAGLFLESGVMALAGSDMTHAVAVATSPGPHRALRERALGLDPHPLAGARLAEGYRLPDDLVRAIREHHAPQPPDDLLARLAWAAERVAALFESPNVDEARSGAVGALRTLDLDPSDLDAITEALPSELTEAAAVFERDVGPQLPLETLLLDANRRLLEANLHYEAVVQALEAALADKDRLADELRRANEHLQALSETDPLTGLGNRRALTLAMDRELARAERSGEGVVLAIADLDHFKHVNDTHGHDVGDRVLAVVARTLVRVFRASDVVARYGGEEFVIVAPSCREDCAMQTLERARAAVEALAIATPGGSVCVTLSFGAASVCGARCRGAGPELLRRADAALYEAKRGGRNRVVQAQPI